MKLKKLLAILALTGLLAGCTALGSPTPITNQGPPELPPVSISTTPYPQPQVTYPAPTLEVYPVPGSSSSLAPTISYLAPSPAVLPPAEYAPQPGDASLARGEVTLDIASSQLVVGSSSPVEVSVSLVGSLPDPCHKLRVEVTPANEVNAIQLSVYSVFDQAGSCITLIKPFTTTIPLGSYTSGHYTVYVNDQLLGEFDG